MDLPEVKAFLDEHYVEVTVDVGRFDRNLQVAAALQDHQADWKACLSVLIVDPKTDRLINEAHVSALARCTL